MSEGTFSDIAANIMYKIDLMVYATRIDSDQSAHQPDQGLHTSRQYNA